jgi:ATP-binding cassette subfamily F protein 3
VLLISANGIAVDYGGRTIFSDLSVDITSGERIGVVGENGAGKSTLLRVLAGQEKPDEGTITYSKGLTIGYLVQEPHFAAGLTVHDAVAGAHEEIAALGPRLATIEGELAGASAGGADVDALLAEYGTAQHRYEELGGYDHDARVRRVLAGLGFHGDMLAIEAERLSGGQKKLIGLARLLLTEPNVLLLDEPDNHLDFEGKAFLEEYIREYSGAVAVISHDRYLLDRVARRTLEIEDGALSTWEGGYTAYVDLKEAHLQRRREIYQVQLTDLKRHEEAMYRLIQWARQNPKFAGRAENMKKQVARMREEMIDRPRLVRRRIKLDFGRHEGSRKVLTARDLTVSLGGPGAGPDGEGVGAPREPRTLLAHVGFDVAFGERVGIVGPNGSGKSTLLRVAAGLIPPAGGELRQGVNVRLGYYSQEQETLPPDETPLAWIRQRAALTEQAGINRLRKLLLTYEDMHAPIGKLSGGQKSRLQFERLMLGGYNLLVLDEPTNNIDIASAEVLESALQTFQGTAVIVSHDRYLLDNAVDRILELPGDGTIREYRGNYTYYLEHRPRPVGDSGDVGTAPRSEGGPARAGPRTDSAAPTAEPAGHVSGVGRDGSAPSAPATPKVARAAPANVSHPARARGPSVRRARLALLGLPGVGKRSLVTELAAQRAGEGGGAAIPPGDPPDPIVPLGGALEASIAIATLDGTDGTGLAEAARRAEAILLAQDLADASLGQVAVLRAALAAGGVQIVPRPLPISIRPRARGGLVVTSGDDATRDALIRWCRAHQVTHAEVVVRDNEVSLKPDLLALYAEAAWQRTGGARARQAGAATFRPALVVGTRYDELPSDAATAEEHLRGLAPGFGCVAVSVLDPASLDRLRAALGALVGRQTG